MKKIITCIPLPPPHGGITNWFSILEDEAKKNEYSFVNINTSPGKTIAGRSIFYRIFVQGCRMLKQSIELLKIIKNNKEVHVAHITTSGQLALVRDILFLTIFKNKGIKTVYHLHFGSIPRIFEKRGMEYRLFSKTFSLSSEIITIDLKTYETLCDEYDAYHVHYIPNPVRRISLDEKNEKKTVIFVGNVLKAKGIEELFTAWEDITDKYPEWNLTLAGFCENNYEEYLRNTYSFKNVKMVGYIPHDDVIKEIAESAFLVLPSYTEGFPNVVIEAMMCGKAVIGTDVGAISDILSENCGVVIQPKNVEMLKEHIIKLMDDEKLRKAMGKNGNIKALKEYSSEIIFKKYTDLWSVLEENND